MKFFSRPTIKVLIFLSLFLFSGQTLSAQENDCIGGMDFDGILSKFTTRRTISPEPINKELIGKIPKEKIGFELNEATEKTLRDAGANDLVISLIHKNVLPEVVEAKFLYDIYLNNYESVDIEKLEIALKSAKEFVNKFENKKCYEEHIKYYKEAINLLNPATAVFTKLQIE